MSYCVLSFASHTLSRALFLLISDVSVSLSIRSSVWLLLEEVVCHAPRVRESESEFVIACWRYAMREREGDGDGDGDEDEKAKESLVRILKVLPRIAERYALRICFVFFALLLFVLFVFSHSHTHTRIRALSPSLHLSIFSVYLLLTPPQ